MKRRNKLLWLLSSICALTFTMGFVGCKIDPEGVSVPNATITNLSELYLEKDCVQLNLGESYQIRLSKNEQATYKSENETVATVSSTGEVVAKSKGVTEIIVNTNEKTLKLFVVVYEKEATVNLSFERAEIVLVAGSSVYVSYTLDAEKEVENAIPTFASMDDEVATVQYVANQTVEIQAKDVGSTNIYGTVEGSLACLRVQVIESKLVETTVDNAPSGYENTPVYVKSFEETREFDGEYSSPATHAVEIVTEEIGNPQEEGFTLFGRYDGFTQTEANLGLENRFAYGFIAVIYNSDNNYYQKKILSPQKIYAVEADDDGKFGVMLNDIPQADIGFYAFAEYAEDGEIKTIVSTERLLFGDDKVAIAAIDGVNDILTLHQSKHVNGLYFAHGKVHPDNVTASEAIKAITDKNDVEKTAIYQYDVDIETRTNNDAVTYRPVIGIDFDYTAEELTEWKNRGLTKFRFTFMMQGDEGDQNYRLVRNMRVLSGIHKTDDYTFSEATYTEKTVDFNEWITVEIDIETIIDWFEYVDATAMNAEAYKNQTDYSYYTEFSGAIKCIHSLIQMNNRTDVANANDVCLRHNYTVYVAECAFIK